MTDFTEISETFAFLDDWEARYAFLIDLGRKLPEYPENMRDEAHLVPGCTSRVWMTHAWAQDGGLRLFVDSDAHLVKGLLAVLLALYDGRRAADVLATDPAPAFEQLGLAGHLSPNRRNGFFAVATRIRQLAGVVNS